MRLLLSQASSMVSQNTVRFWTQDNPANPQAVRHKPPRRPERRCQVPYQSPNLRRQSKKGDAPQSLQYSPAPPAAGEVPEAVQRPLKSLSFDAHQFRTRLPLYLLVFSIISKRPCPKLCIFLRIFCRDSARRIKAAPKSGTALKIAEKSRNRLFIQGGLSFGQRLHLPVHFAADHSGNGGHRRDLGNDTPGQLFQELPPSGVGLLRCPR